MQLQFWSDTGLACDDGETLPISSPTPSEDTSSDLLSCVADSPASLFRWQENSRAWLTGDICGQPFATLSDTCDRPMSWLKTSKGYCQRVMSWDDEGEPLELFCETWPASGTMQSGKCYQRQPLVRRIFASESSLLPTPTSVSGGGERSAERAGTGNLQFLAREGLLPTPTATPYGSNQGGEAGREGQLNRPSLQTMASQGLLPTPTEADSRATRNATARRSPGSNHHTGQTLIDVLLPTPISRDHKSGQASAATHAKNCRPLSEQIGGLLNPQFVEAIMGFPAGWTDCDASAMPSSPKSQSS
jgi:hypothetical protein